MKIERATRDDIAFVARNMRERDFAEFSAISRCDTREELADLLTQTYGGREDIICGAKDEPICIGITVEVWPNVMSLGFLATDRFPEIGRPITKFTKDLLAKYEAAGVHRVQAISIEGYDTTHRWLETLGLKREVVMPGYGRNNETFVQFARVNASSSRA